uniref:Uncharacterized protein n=1 Tax=Cacopsylla melanoneura TaxID=428564 RepID=A0A8D8LWW9_9HEMI
MFNRHASQANRIHFSIDCVLAINSHLLVIRALSAWNLDQFISINPLLWLTVLYQLVAITQEIIMVSMQPGLNSVRNMHGKQLLSLSKLAMFSSNPIKDSHTRTLFTSLLTISLIILSSS